MGYYEAKSETTGKRNWRIAGCDLLLSESGITTHHLVIIPDSVTPACTMNPTATTAGGYLNSYIRKNTLERIRLLIETTFGAEHLLAYTENLVSEVSDGVPSAVASAECKVELLSEAMVTGQTSKQAKSNGVVLSQTHQQFPLFAHRPEYRSVSQQYWLRDVYNSENFLTVNKSLNVVNKAANSSYYLRPFFLLH